MQIVLTFRNNLRNVKRRVLHTRGSAMYYITRLGSLRSLVSTKLSASSFSRGLRPLVSTQPYGCWLDSVDSL